MAVLAVENTSERHDVEQSEQTSSVKGEILNILGFIGHKVSVGTTQHYSKSLKAIIDNM